MRVPRWKGIGNTGRAIPVINSFVSYATSAHGKDGLHIICKGERGGLTPVDWIQDSAPIGSSLEFFPGTVGSVAVRDERRARQRFAQISKL